MSGAALDPKPPRPGRRLIKRFALGAFMIVALSAGTWLPMCASSKISAAWRM